MANHPHPVGVQASACLRILGHRTRRAQPTHPKYYSHATARAARTPRLGATVLESSTNPCLLFSQHPTPKTGTHATLTWHRCGTQSGPIGTKYETLSRIRP